MEIGVESTCGSLLQIIYYRASPKFYRDLASHLQSPLSQSKCYEAPPNQFLDCTLHRTDTPGV